jgi:cell division protein FtsZ
MKGAKGVIISNTGGEDMRLMEVDEAANHIKELVDPDANIIWGSAFNNDLEGKIRVSVVATGIDAEIQAPAAPAKVFAFPGAARTVEPIRTPGSASVAAAPVAAPAPVAQMAPAPQPAPEPLAEAPQPAPTMAAEPDLLSIPSVSFDDTNDGGEELLLDAGSMMEPEQPQQAANAPGNRSWLGPVPEEAPQPTVRREGGTLFERMSNIARGAAKAQVDEEPQAPTRANGRDPLDIPRFLNRQNNQ